MAEFRFFLNKQGAKGAKGDKGDEGFSPKITEEVSSNVEYKLRITNETGSFITPNLMSSFQMTDKGGEFLMFDRETREVQATDPKEATEISLGAGRLASTEDLERISENRAIIISPKTLSEGVKRNLQSGDGSIIITRNDSDGKTNLQVNNTSIISQINQLRNDLTQESNVRFAADSQQQTAIDAERRERETQDASLQTQLGSKITTDNIKAGEGINVSVEGNNVTITSTVTPGGSYTAGNGISLENDIISAKVDGQTIQFQDGVMHANFDEIAGDITVLGNRVNNLEDAVVVAGYDHVGLVKPDGQTVTIDENGTLSATGGGGGPTPVDNVTIEINSEGKLQTTVDINALQEKVEELQLFKFPNATIIGEPTINNGQVSNFSTTSYLRFPFEFETKGRTWLLNGSFDTGSDVTTQQNIIDSLASVAMAVRSGRLVIALSTNGTSFDLGEHLSMSDIEPNTKYFYRLSFSGTQYLLSLSTDKEEWMPEIVVTSSTPIASKPMTISSPGHPFGGVINLNDWDLTVGNILVWQGMDDVGIASRMDVNASNATDSAKKEVMLNTNGLESGEKETSDALLFNEVRDRKRSTFDRSKFTVVGTPSISEDGIASGFSSSDYLSGKEITIPSNSNTTITMEYTPIGTAKNMQLFGIGNYNSKIGIINTYGKLQLYIGGSNFYTTNVVFNNNNSYTIKLDIKNNIAKLYYKLSSVNIFTEVEGSINFTNNITDELFIGNTKYNTNLYTNGSIDLSQFSIEVDGVEVFNGNKTGIDIIKEDNFEKVGDPVISEYGILTNQSNGNYLHESINIPSGSNIRILSKFKTQSNMSVDQRYWSLGDSTGRILSSEILINRITVWCAKTLTQTGLVNRINESISIAPNTDLYIDFNYNQSNKTLYFKYSFDGKNWMDAQQTQYATLSESLPTITYIDTFWGTNTVTDAETDLSELKVYVDGNLIYQPTLRIPYTQSKTGSKIVDSVYKSRVKDAFEFNGEANYYVLDEAESTTQLPKGDIYGMIARLSDTVKKISSDIGNIEELVDLINGSYDGANSLAAMPMLLSLEPTELDLEDSFTSNRSRAVFNNDLVLPTNSVESYDDDTDIDLGGNE